MRSSCLVVASVLFLLLATPSFGTEFRPIVIVYDGRMLGLAEGVAQILESSSTGGEEFMPVTDPVLVASMLGLPNIRCLILTSVGSADLHPLIKPVIGYFEGGGSAIGFHGSCWQNQVDDMARIVFPAYGNSTGVGVRKNGLNVEEYVRENSLGGIGDELPEEFDLVGQFIALAKDTEKNVVSPTPPKGKKTVLYKDKKSGAPLVIAYEGDSGSRSISFTGTFLRDSPDAGSHYGKLLEQPEFRSLLSDCYRWTAEGNTRYNSYSEDYEQIVADMEKARGDLVVRSEEREASRRSRKTLMLAIFWVLGLACIVGLAYWAFMGQRGSQ